MSITYDWIFNPLVVKPQEGSLDDVVIVVNWRRTAVDGAYSSSCYGQITLGPPNPQDYTRFEDLTKDQVAGWVVDSLTQELVGQYDQSLAVDIANQKNPPVVSLPPPWM